MKENNQPTFSDRVIDAALSIPEGRVTTYGHVACAAGGTGQSARSVSGILSRAFMRGVTGIPWHRIVYSNGTIWINGEHYDARMKLYAQEGISVDAKGRVLNFRKILHTF